MAEEEITYDRAPVIPTEQKTRIVLSILASEVMIAEAARKEKVSEQSISSWKAEFLEVEQRTLASDRTDPTTRETQLEAESAELTTALGEARLEARVWKKRAEDRLSPSRTLR